MEALQLLATIQARGGVARIRRNANGVDVLNVSPNYVALGLACDIQRFKSVLLELLARSDETRIQLQALDERVGPNRAAQAIAWAHQRLKCEKARLYHSMNPHERHAYSVCLAWLDSRERGGFR